ncbi:MAG: dienelactone hydrolase family protein [Gemmatimonadales bacterium]
MAVALLAVLAAPCEAQAFAGRGYVFLLLFRRGHGLSTEQGPFVGDLLERQLGDSGEDARNRLQIRLLETDHLDDARAGLAFLRALDQVDPERVAAIGHSFGGSLTLLVAEPDSSLRAAVDFAGAAESWRRSPHRRARLLAAVGRSVVPTFFIQAANDYSVAPARALAAEMTRLGKAHRLKIYPPFGRTPAEVTPSSTGLRRPGRRTCSRF